MNKIRLIIAIQLLSIIFVMNNCYSQWLNSGWKEAVVPIEIRNNDEYITIATGFIFRHTQIHFLVTNRHVVIDSSGYYFRTKTIDNPPKTIHWSIDEMIQYYKYAWIFSDEADVAIIPLDIPPSLLNQYTIHIFPFAPSVVEKWEYVREGADVFILGYPISIVGLNDNAPVYRSGIVAQKYQNGKFLIDSNIYPGNSGSPVIIGPYIIDAETGVIKPNTKTYVVGIVSNYLPYIDRAISVQTKRTRITFEENSGLSTVYSSESFLDLIVKYVETQKKQNN